MRLALVLVTALLLGGCSGGSDEPDEPAPSSPPASTSVPESATPSPAVVPQPPQDRACYRLDYTEAVAPTVDVRSTPCARPHTSMTFAVGPLDAVVDGHLLAVDSARVRDQVAQTCPERFAAFVGGTPEDQRLSMLRPVWFTPTVEESDAGADWFRCDVVALAGPDRLAWLDGTLRGALSRPAGESYAMCGTAEPGRPDFERVPCGARHSWRAVRTVSLAAEAGPKGVYPGAAAARAAGQQICKDVGQRASSDKLNFSWGYEWPSATQWSGGQTYGLCWIPD